jgi:hypothetical protein
MHWYRWKYKRRHRPSALKSGQWLTQWLTIPRCAIFCKLFLLHNMFYIICCVSCRRCSVWPQQLSRDDGCLFRVVTGPVNFLTGINNDICLLLCIKCCVSGLRWLFTEMFATVRMHSETHCSDVLVMQGFSLVWKVLRILLLVKENCMFD